MGTDGARDGVEVGLASDDTRCELNGLLQPSPVVPGRHPEQDVLFRTQKQCLRLAAGPVQEQQRWVAVLAIFFVIINKYNMTWYGTQCRTALQQWQHATSLLSWFLLQLLDSLAPCSFDSLWLKLAEKV